MKLKYLSFVLIAVYALTFGHAGEAQLTESDLENFSLSNPDGNKYDFVKAYISALEHLYHNEKLQHEATQISSVNIKNVAVITKERDRLVNVNVNLRIARNLVDRFERSPNGLINSVIMKFSEFANKQVELNNQERFMLETIRTKIIDGAMDESAIKWYGETITEILAARRESSKQLLEASLLVNKILISHQFNRSGQLYKLGITQEERRNLLKRLRQFSDEGFKGEMRSGQTFLEASVSSIRQLLEDTQWPSSEKI